MVPDGRAGGTIRITQRGSRTAPVRREQTPASAQPAYVHLLWRPLGLAIQGDKHQAKSQYGHDPMGDKTGQLANPDRRERSLSPLATGTHPVGTIMCWRGEIQIHPLRQKTPTRSFLSVLSTTGIKGGPKAKLWTGAEPSLHRRVRRRGGSPGITTTTDRCLALV